MKKIFTFQCSTIEEIVDTFFFAFGIYDRCKCILLKYVSRSVLMMEGIMLFWVVCTCYFPYGIPLLMTKQSIEEWKRGMHLRKEGVYYIGGFILITILFVMSSSRYVSNPIVLARTIYTCRSHVQLLERRMARRDQGSNSHHRNQD